MVDTTIKAGGNRWPWLFRPTPTCKPVTRGGSAKTFRIRSIINMDGVLPGRAQQRRGRFDRLRRGLVIPTSSDITTSDRLGEQSARLSILLG